jgi:hypothetical protein
MLSVKTMKSRPRNLVDALEGFVLCLFYTLSSLKVADPLVSCEVVAPCRNLLNQAADQSI